jgi:hypothetical protein
MHSAEDVPAHAVARPGLKEEPVSIRFRPVVSLCIAGMCAVAFLAAPARAAFNPYARVEWGGNQLKMSEGNELIQQNENDLRASGYPAEFRPVGAGYGPGATLGLWISGGLRVGATCSYLHSVRENHLHVPGQIFWADDVDFRMTEIGVESALRFSKLGGFILGGKVARGRCRMTEGYSDESWSGVYYQDALARGAINTYGGYLGFEQTGSTGVAGYIHMGYQFRDVGSLPSELTISDGSTTSQASGRTVPLDLSGVYIHAGFGFDVGR